MRESLLGMLACPVCYSDKLTLTIHDCDKREIREGELGCTACQAHIPIQKGIVHALLNPSQAIINETKGWVELLDVPANQHEFKDDWILALPFIHSEQSPHQESVQAWHRMGQNFFKSLDRFDWRNKRVLEIGAGRCWGVAELARRGAYAVGLDILAYKYLGLETADIWFAAEDLYFERVLGDMHRLPFRTKVFDFVITTASLHHTNTLGVALNEIARVLIPEGRTFFINEPVIADDEPRPNLSDSPEVLYGIVETRPTYREWMAAFARAGLGLEGIWFEDGMHILLRKGEAVIKPVPFPGSMPQYRGLRKSRRWRRVEHRFWTAYDYIKAYIFGRLLQYQEKR